MITQTDSQTDKATNWAVTAFNENEMLALESNDKFPHFIKTVYGGREKCEDTGRIHFQGHIQCHAQQRFVTIKKWLPTAHLTIARNFKASVTYAMKKDTAIGIKQILYGPETYVDNQEALMMLARTCPQMCSTHTFYDPNSDGPEKNVPVCADDNQDFWHRVNIVLSDRPHLVGLLSKPDIQRAWKWTKFTWFEKVREEGQIVLPAPPEEGSEEFEFGSDSNEIVSGASGI